ncbi:MAG: hypothetical protein AB1758_04685 [Candidatus Eremiobacterota bacterium]
MKRHHKGASLAEVMLAMMVVAIYSLGVLSAVSKSTELNQKDQELTKAQALCQQRLEELVRLSREDFNHDELTTTGAIPNPSDYRFLDTNGDGVTNPSDILVYRTVRSQVSATIRKVTVEVYYARQGVPGPTNDTTRPRAGWILQMSTLVTSS